MTFFRKLGWWRRRDRKQAELGEELQFHLDEEAAEREADGLPAGSSRSRRAPQSWKPHRGGGAGPRRLDVDAAGAARPGHPLRDARDGPQPRVHRADGPVARAGHRREHRHLQLHGRGADAISACPGPGIAGRRELAKPRCHTRCAGQSRVRHALHERKRERRWRGRAEVGHLPVPRVRAPAEAIGRRLFQRLRVLPEPRGQSPDRWPGRCRTGRIRLGRLLSRPRGESGRWTPACRRRRPRGRTSGGGRQPRVQRAPLRRRGSRTRAVDGDQRGALHHRRRHATGFLRRGSGRGAGLLPADARQPAGGWGRAQRCHAGISTSRRTTTGSR